MAYFLICFYLPIYFQAIEGVSPISSGVRNLPLIFGACKFLYVSKPRCSTDDCLSTFLYGKRWPCWCCRLFSAISPHWRNLCHCWLRPPLHPWNQLLFSPIHRLSNHYRYRYWYFHPSTRDRRPGAFLHGRHPPRYCRCVVYVFHPDFMSQISSYRAVLSRQQFSSLYRAHSPSPSRNRFLPTVSYLLYRTSRPTLTPNSFLSPALPRFGRLLLVRKCLESYCHT